MPNVNVVDMKGNEVGEALALSDKIFGAEINSDVLHAVVKAYLANQRQGTQSTLTRTEVSGGGRKPWRQKGTGRARQGSTRSPQWTHGGVALGPKPRSYRVTINKKVKRVALCSALSAKVAENELVVINEIKLETFKTKEMVGMLKAIGAEKTVTRSFKVVGSDEKKTREVIVPKKALIVLPEVDYTVQKSCENIPGVKVATWNTMNVYEILNAEKLVMAKEAVIRLQNKLEEVSA